MSLLLLRGCGVFHALRLHLFRIVLLFKCLGGTGRFAGSRYELHAALFNVNLQGTDELPAVVALDELVAHGKPGAEHILLLLGDFRLADTLRDAYPVCGDIGNLVCLAVDADVGGRDFSRFLVHKIHDPAEVARFAQVLPVLVRKLVFLILAEFLLLADEMRHEADIALAVLLEREAGIKVKGFAPELGRYLHQVGLAVVEHLGQVAGLLKVVALHPPFLFQFLPVDLALVNGLVAPSALRLLRAFLILFLFLFHVFLFLGFFRLMFFLFSFFLLLFRFSGGLFFLHLFLVAGGVHLVGCKHLLVGFGVFQQLLHYFQQMVCLVRRDAVEPEAAGFLALPVEVPEEVVQHIAVSVELQETLRVLRLCGGALGGAVGIQPGHHADLARFLVADNQHVLFCCFLCHFD